MAENEKNNKKGTLVKIMKVFGIPTKETKEIKDL